MAVCFVTSTAYVIVSPIAKEKVAERRALLLDAREAYSLTQETPIITQAGATEHTSPTNAPETLATNIQDDNKAVATKPNPVPNPGPTLTPSGYTLTEVATHADASSCWTAIEGSVYDLTSFISHHSGGDRAILTLCGKDGTTAFAKKHGGKSKPEQMLKTLYLGPLIP